MIDIYKLRCEKKQLLALQLIDENTDKFKEEPFLIELKKQIGEEFVSNIRQKISYLDNKNKYKEIIDLINGLDEPYKNEFINNKESAEINYAQEVIVKVNDCIENKDLQGAKETVMEAYNYLKNIDNFNKVYEQWHDYQPNLLIY